MYIYMIDVGENTIFSKEFAQCIMYTVHCTVYSVQCNVYNVQCTVYSIQCTM